MKGAEVAKKQKKITLDEFEKVHPDRFISAKKAIDLAESFPVKGGDVIHKKTGGWFESLRNNNTKTAGKTAA